jgi:hypothetical protein
MGTDLKRRSKIAVYLYQHSERLLERIHAVSYIRAKGVGVTNVESAQSALYTEHNDWSY